VGHLDIFFPSFVSGKQNIFSVKDRYVQTDGLQTRRTTCYERIEAVQTMPHHTNGEAALEFDSIEDSIQAFSTYSSYTGPVTLKMLFMTASFVLFYSTFFMCFFRQIMVYLDVDYPVS